MRYYLSQQILTQIKVINQRIQINIDKFTLMIQEVIGKFSQKIKQSEESKQIESSAIKKEQQSCLTNQKVEIGSKKVSNKISGVSPIKSKIEQEKTQKHQNTNLSLKWSQQLKSKLMEINGNLVRLTKKTRYSYEFCLLNVSFSNAITVKQSYAIKINKMTGWIHLRVCLKSKILNYNFSSQNMNWKQTGHGLYMIGSGGGCLSHSQKEFNQVIKSFKFGENDVIFIEFDPIYKKLRFSKNKIEHFEMPIIIPQQNDVYHPCVSLGNANDSVELLPLSN